MAIDQALQMRFADQIELAFQQKISMLRDKVMVDTGSGTHKAFNVMPPTGAPNELTNVRGSATVWRDPDDYNRWAPHRWFSEAMKLSRYDALSAITDLRRPYVNTMVASHNRNIDIVIVNSALGSAAQGQTPGAVAAEAFDTAAPNADGTGGNLIAAGGTGMTDTKLKDAMGFFLSRSVGVGINGMLAPNEFTAMMTGRQMRQLLDLTPVTSWDFVGNLGPDNAPNVRGFVARYAGFNLIVVDPAVLPVTAGVRRCLVWHREAVGLALWTGTFAAGNVPGEGAITSSFYVTVDRLPTFNNDIGMQVQANFGAVRIQSKGVIAIDCTE